MTAKAKYTVSPWSGEKYEKTPTDDQLMAESKKVLHSNPAIARTMANTDAWLAEYRKQTTPTKG